MTQKQKIIKKTDGSKTVVRGGRIVGNLPSDSARNAPSAAYNGPDAGLPEAAAAIAPSYSDAYAAFSRRPSTPPNSLAEWAAAMRNAGDARLDGVMSRADHAVLTLQADQWLRANNYTWEDLETAHRNQINRPDPPPRVGGSEAPLPEPAPEPEPEPLSSEPPASWQPRSPREFRGARWTPGYRPAADIARDIRNDLKEARKGGDIPSDLKMSVRIKNYAGGRSINVTLSGWEKERIWTEEVDAYGHPMRRETEEAKAVRDKVEAIREAYNRDNSDASIDYFDTDYYGSSNWDWRIEYP